MIQLPQKHITQGVSCDASTRNQLTVVSPVSCTVTAISLEEYAAGLGSGAGLFVVCPTKVINYCYAAVIRKFPLQQPGDGPKWFSKW